MSQEENPEPQTAGAGGLQLQRPVVFLDVQTTGPDQRTARIVQLSTLRIDPDGSEDFRSQLINPMSPISPGASDFHGVTDDDVIDAKPFAAFAKSLQEYLDGCDLAGFGIRRFHLKVLKREFEYSGIDFNMDERVVVDVMEIFHRLEPRDFGAAHREYVGTDFARPADPETTVNAARAILMGQLRRNPEIPADPASLEAWATGEFTESYIDDQGRFTLSDDGDPIVNFGRFRGHTLYDVSESHPDYLRWIAGDDSFTDQQRRIAADAADGIMPDV